MIDLHPSDDSVFKLTIEYTDFSDSDFEYEPYVAFSDNWDQLLQHGLKQRGTILRKLNVAIADFRIQVYSFHQTARSPKPGKIE